MKKEQLLNALGKLKKLNRSMKRDTPDEKSAGTSAWEFTYAEPKPPLNMNPYYGSGIRPRSKTKGK